MAPSYKRGVQKYNVSEKDKWSPEVCLEQTHNYKTNAKMFVYKTPWIGFRRC